MSRARILTVRADPAAVHRAAAVRFAAIARAAVRARSRFVVVLAGGSTPRGLYRRLAAPRCAAVVPWTATHVLFGDERCVPPDHPDSNYGMAREALLAHVPLPPSQVHRIGGELDDHERAAQAYEQRLREQVFPGEAEPRADLVLLGVGADGHTASLFPGSAALEERRRWVVAAQGPGHRGARITLTLPALDAARKVLFLVVGADKAQVVAEAFGGLAHPDTYPCERVRPTAGSVEVLLDRAAAARLA